MKIDRDWDREWEWEAILRMWYEGKEREVEREKRRDTEKENERDTCWGTGRT